MHTEFFPKIRSRVHMDSVLTQMNPVYNLTLRPCNIIIPTLLKSVKWLLLLRLSDQNVVCTGLLTSRMNAICPTHLITTQVFVLF